jgi:hypothetical protein
MSLGALATGPCRSSADADDAHAISVKAKHDASLDMTSPDDFDPRRMMPPFFCLAITKKGEMITLPFFGYGLTLRAASGPADQFHAR